VTPAILDDPATAAIRLAIEAMATRFELVFPPAGDARAGDRLRAVGEESLAEVARQEARLSAYRAASDIAWINGHASDRAVKVEPGLFALLTRCLALSEATAGAFDITVGPLMRVWQFAGAGAGGSRPLPSAGLVADARGRVGYQHVRLDPDASTIRFDRHGMSIDLGAAGKGHAIDLAAGVLRAHGVTSALLQGGTSSVHAVGAPPDGSAWTIAWDTPICRRRFPLRDAALSISAAHGKAFTHDGRVYGHVIDPRTGWPSDGASSALVTGPGSLECDALSTALLVLGAGWLPTLRARFPGYDGVVA
jgi:thiamine biosynthesis lipoprotein